MTIVPGLRTASTRSSSLRLISRFSATASMIQSASAHHARLSSKLPGVISRAVSGVKNAAGRDFFAASSPRDTMRLRTAGFSSVSPLRFSSAFNSGGTISSKIAGNAGIGKVRRDARAHRARAQHRRFFDRASHQSHPLTGHMVAKAPTRVNRKRPASVQVC